METQKLPFHLSAASRSALAQLNIRSIASTTCLGSGDYNCYRIVTSDARCFIFKVLSEHFSNQINPIQCEAQSLRLLKKNCDTLSFPNIAFQNESLLVLDFIQEGTQRRDYWQRLAQGLAELHKAQATADTGLQNPYGYAEDNYIGESIQQNDWYEDGYQFYSEKRFMPQVKQAFDNGLIQSQWVIALESICERLEQLVPWQQASLLHGDLWSGNILVSTTGDPVLIDPACYYGWRETDIAMTKLFGGFPECFYSAYNECWPLEKGWEKRSELHNIYHLLNHLNLFGESYLDLVHHSIKKFA